MGAQSLATTAGVASIATAQIEATCGNLRPDVLLVLEGEVAEALLGSDRRLAVEIRFRHRVGSEKQGRSKVASLAMLEINVASFTHQTPIEDEHFGQFMRRALAAARWICLPSAENLLSPTVSQSVDAAATTEPRHSDVNDSALHWLEARQSGTVTKRPSLATYSSASMRWQHQYPSVARKRKSGVVIARECLKSRSAHIQEAIGPLLAKLEGIPDQQEAWQCDACLTFHALVAPGDSGCPRCPGCGHPNLAVFEENGPECYETLVYRLERRLPAGSRVI